MTLQLDETQALPARWRAISPSVKYHTDMYPKIPNAFKPLERKKKSIVHS